MKEAARIARKAAKPTLRKDWAAASNTDSARVVGFLGWLLAVACFLMAFANQPNGEEMTGGARAGFVAGGVVILFVAWVWRAALKTEPRQTDREGEPRRAAPRR